MQVFLSDSNKKTILITSIQTDYCAIPNHSMLFWKPSVPLKGYTLTKLGYNLYKVKYKRTSSKWKSQPGLDFKNELPLKHLR